MAPHKTKVILLSYLPFAISYLAYKSPELSFLIAWSGSFYIFHLTLFSRMQVLSSDGGLREQVLRPIVLIQFVFAGFMCITSIFYFLEHLNYFQFSMSQLTTKFERKTYLIAECQRLCVLAHAALITGMIAAGNARERPRYLLSIDPDSFLILISILSGILAHFTKQVPAVFQFSIGLNSISLFSSAFLIVVGLRKKKVINLVIGGAIFSFYVSSHLISGYKEAILIDFILLIVLFFPYYRKRVVVISVFLGMALLYFLPTYTTVIRHFVWTGTGCIDEAKEHFFKLFSGEDSNNEIDMNNKEFFTTRLSEIGMFVKFAETTPDKLPYYGEQIFINALYALIPRALWHEKPNTEEIAMRRVYSADVVDITSKVSAKTRPVVDGYLSAGAAGVFIDIFLYGWLAQYLCNKAELLLGGYSLGCGLFYNSIFQHLWRGNNIEFLLNNVVYGTILMLIIFAFLKLSGIISPNKC